MPHESSPPAGIKSPHFSWPWPDQAGGRERLADVLRLIIAGNGSYRFILLRESPLDERAIDQGDIDLLGTRASVEALLDVLLQEALRGRIHFRVTCDRSDKVQLTVHAPDFQHAVVFDLWMRLPQINRGRYFITADDVAALAAPACGAIDRLPECVEAAIYLHHLASKRKSFSEPHTRARIADFGSHQCADANCGVRDWFGEIQTTNDISQSALRASQEFLERRLDLVFADGRHHDVGRHRKRINRRAMCVVGVDGVGKSTLIDALAKRADLIAGVLTGKKLYRRSWLYRLLTRQARQADAGAREAFDERWSAPLFLRAAGALRIWLTALAMRRRGLLLIDRSPADFLLRRRKTDAPELHPWAAALLRCAPALPTLHLVAPHETTSARKSEVTAAGHARYDRIQLRLHTRRVPCDYLVFHNGCSLEESRASLSRALENHFGQSISKTATRRSSSLHSDSH